MTTAMFVLAAFTAVPLFLAASIRLGRRPSPVVHLLTARQAAEAVGVSVAAVQAWQRDGLLPSVYCTACGSAGTPPAAIAALVQRTDATPSVVPDAVPGEWVALSRNRWPA